MVRGIGCLNVGGARGVVEEDGGEEGDGVARDEGSWTSGATASSSTLDWTSSETMGPVDPETTSSGLDGPDFTASTTIELRLHKCEPFLLMCCEELGFIAPDAVRNNKCGHGFERRGFLEDWGEEWSEKPQEISRGKEFGASNLRKSMPGSLGYRLRQEEGDEEKHMNAKTSKQTHDTQIYPGSDLLSTGVLRPVPEQQLRISLTRVQSPLRTLQHPAPQLVFLHTKGTIHPGSHQIYTKASEQELEQNGSEAWLYRKLAESLKDC
ncbi:hypothetical protein Taro_030764 [Colocasia esculenta]|uniref:Uncharacterized protein n=1 Tax=Colocasia esculenta TaxID=4460 RepID=A0A843VSR9_COLES|nr:hypothetical protein [Colocasia esculenta]